MDDNGFIVIHRKMQKWEWFDDLNMCGFFLHLLLLANWEDRRWHGIVIKRGSFVTSYRKLADSMHVSEATIRRWIKRLISTGEVAVNNTSRYTVISIVSYDFYQTKKESNDAQKTHSRRTSNAQPSHERYTTEQYNNNNNNNNKNNSLSASADERENFSVELVEQWANEFDDPNGKIVPAGYVAHVKGHGGNKDKDSFDSYCYNILHLQKIGDKKQKVETKTPEQIRQEEIDKWYAE